MESVNKKSSVVILAGGKGTRLSEIIGNLPKPMTPILGVPVLEYLVSLSVRHGFPDIVILAHHNYQAITSYFGDGSKYGASINYSIESSPRGTAGALYDALPFLDTNFLVLYGDTYADVNLRNLWNYHLTHKSDATLFIHPNNHPHDSDLVLIDEFNNVTEISSYPHSPGKIYQNLVNAGMYVFKKSLIEKFGYQSGLHDIAKDFFKKVVSEEIVFKGYKSVEYIKDMGTPERLNKVELAVQNGIPTRLSDETKRACIFLDRDGTIIDEVGHLSSLDEVNLIPGSADAIKKINENGILSIVITNQPVIARGDLDFSELKKIHNFIETRLGYKGAYLDEIYICPHHPECGFPGERSEFKIACDCRKPGTRLLDEAIKKFNIERGASWMVGDSTSDILAGQAAGLRTILVSTGHAGQDFKYICKPEYIVASIREAVNWAIEGHKKMWKLLNNLIDLAVEGRVIMIGGLSRSGKSFAAQVLKEQLLEYGFRVHIISIDGWLKNSKERLEGEGVLNRYDLFSFSEFIMNIINSKSPIFIQIPFYDRRSKEILLSGYVTINPADKIIIEGVPAFHCEDLLRASSLNIYVESDEEIRNARIQSDYAHRGLQAAEIFKLIESRLLDEVPIILSGRNRANFVIGNE